MSDLSGVAGEVRVTIKAFSDFSDKVREATDNLRRLTGLAFRKTGGTFIYCTWTARTGPHSVTRCTFKTRIIRGGPKKMRHHFAKEHFVEL